MESGVCWVGTPVLHHKAWSVNPELVEKVSLRLQSKSNYWGNHGSMQNEDRSKRDAQEPVVGTKEETQQFAA